jgi:putative SOS response-associated peptidase YedK
VSKDFLIACNGNQIDNEYMCGRLSNKAKPESYKKEFKVGKLNPAIFNPRYNIAPENCQMTLK